MRAGRWLGIDFSGNHLQWRPRCRTSNVWIAEVRSVRRGLVLHDVRRVQQLPGTGDPFDRLAALLEVGEYIAAGVDAPFSVPAMFVRGVGSHADLVRLVGSKATTDRPFVSGVDMVRLVAGQTRPLNPPKPLRETDDVWRRKGVNIRSPMWTGARPGAPMTAACLTLLHRAHCPVWPWSGRGPRLLVEAFPAGQLKTWQLPYVRYDGSSPAAKTTRKKILESISTHICVGVWGPALLASADALDSVLCAFAAIAVSTTPRPRFGSAPRRVGFWSIPDRLPRRASSS
jgi:hypothetical protein